MPEHLSHVGERPPGTRWRLRIEHTWNGNPVDDDEAVSVGLERAERHLLLRIDAPFHNDPPPASDDLWHYEVVEVMLLGEDDRYVEIELSPHGQSLALSLHGERNVVERGAMLDYKAQIQPGRWHGVARVPLPWLPAGTNRLNAFAIHGPSARRYLAWKPTGGPEPDFHRLGQYGFFSECAVERRAEADSGA